MSPEALTGKLQGSESDWWSLGCLVYYVNFGKLIFKPCRMTFNDMLTCLNDKYDHVKGLVDPELII